MSGNEITYINDVSEISVPYAKGGVVPQIVVFNGDDQLAMDKDYKVSASKNNKVTDGAKLTIKGIGNYTGKISGLYSITPSTQPTDKVSLTNKKVKVTIADKDYLNGQRVHLDPKDISVTYEGLPLTYGSDYVIDERSYLNNKDAGKGSIILRAVAGSNYTGAKRVKFKIKSKSIFWWVNK